MPPPRCSEEFKRDAMRLVTNDGFSGRREKRFEPSHTEFDGGGVSLRASLQTLLWGTSALSNLDFGVHGLQLASGVVDFHLPVDAALSGIHVRRPGGCFCLQGFGVAKSSSGDALAGH